MTPRRAILAGAAATVLAGCDQQAFGTAAATSKTYVLVDLSRTWHNPASAEVNKRVLTEIGQGLALYAQDATPPIEFQYRAIGARGLDRSPLREIRFEPSVVGMRANDPPYLVKSLKKLQGILATDCVDGILALEAEPVTEIQPVLASIARRAELTKTRKQIIVASDLREEMLGEPANLPDLKGFNVLLVFRPVEDDLVHRTQADARVEYWKSVLTGRNAQVSDMLDADIKRNDIVQFLGTKA